MLDTALSLFLDKGFEQTTIDLIAASVGMTKRTIYAKYEDKAALFRAAVERAIALSHELYCSASIILAKTAEITTSHEIIEA